MFKSLARFSSLAVGVAALAVALGLLLTGCGGEEPAATSQSDAPSIITSESSSTVQPAAAQLADLPWGDTTDRLHWFGDDDGKYQYQDYGITLQYGQGDEKSEKLKLVWGNPLGSQLLTGLQEAAVMGKPTAPPSDTAWVLLRVWDDGFFYSYLACEDKTLYTIQDGKAYQLQTSEDNFDSLRGLFVEAALGHIPPEQAASEAMQPSDYGRMAQGLLKLLPDTGALPLPPAVSTASSIPTLDGQQAIAPWWKTIFSCQDTLNTLRYTYLHNDTTKLSYSAGRSVENLVYLLSVSDAGENLGEPVLPDQWVEIVLDSDDKYSVRFFEKGVELTYSHWKLEDKMVATLRIDKTELYNNLLADLKTLPNEGLAPIPLWLGMMNRGRITTVTAMDKSGNKATNNDYADDGILLYEHVDPMLRNLEVKPGVRVLPTATTVDADCTMRVRFDNRVSYLVMLDATSLYIRSSDVEQMLQYTLADPATARKSVVRMAEGNINPDMPNYDHTFAPTAPDRVNPETGKPVIYLYPTEATDCTVKVDYPAFTYTYPTYNDGWQVTAYPDGRLVNKADGSEHYYLFWEGNQQIEWRFDSGFVVAGQDVEAFLREKLPAMGLTPREYNDFITWWVPKMQHNPYNLITFATNQYEALAPLTVTPTPDSILRVHMVYKPLSAPVSIPEQTLSGFVRTGFTVVEWGGTLAR